MATLKRKAYDAIANGTHIALRTLWAQIPGVCLVIILYYFVDVNIIATILLTIVWSAITFSQIDSSINKDYKKLHTQTHRLYASTKTKLIMAYAEIAFLNNVTEDEFIESFTINTDTMAEKPSKVEVVMDLRQIYKRIVHKYKGTH